ncbi:Zeta-crystallin [Dactylella cylindrospora]|nr:Zeta-crystallin [Dactylella cylindrospora]
MSYNTKQWIFKEYPGGDLDIEKIFELRTTQISINDLQKGQLLVKPVAFSNDPGQRLWISTIPGATARFDVVAVKSGSVMKAFAIGEVVESRDERYNKGDLVQAILTWAEYSIVDAAAVFYKSSNDPVETLALGSTAQAAYLGLFNVANLTSNDNTIVISGAAGATGSAACQIAKNIVGVKKVIGIAGTDEKCKLVTDQCGCDIALNYKSPTFEADLLKATEGGVDVYFDNVGGSITDLILTQMNDFGRVVVCGAISGYGQKNEKIISKDSWAQIMIGSLKVIGFIAFDFLPELPKAAQELDKWQREGKVTALKTVWNLKFEDIPTGMLKLFKGDNIGKAVTKLI